MIKPSISIIIVCFIFTNAIFLQAKHESIFASHDLIKTTSSDTIKYPWNLLDLSSQKMKPGFPFVTIEKNKNSLLPYFIGIPLTGGVIYLLTKKDNDSVDCSITITSSVTPESCGLMNGSASVTVQPIGQYQYFWSNGSTSNSITNVPSGVYSVTVQLNGTGCSQTLNLTIPESTVAFETQVITTEADCNQNNGSAEATVSPSDEYSFQWSNGATGNSINNLSPGEYSVTISRGQGCFKVEQFTIEQLSPSFNLSTQSSAASCSLNNGSAEVLVEPAGTYNYDWSNGSISSQLLNIPSGTYSVTVSDSNECTRSTTVTVEELEVDFMLSISSLPAKCGFSDGSAEVTVEPQGTYTYQWSNGITGLINTELSSGEYIVTVSDDNGCSTTQSVIIEEIPAEIDLIFTTSSASCGIENGSASVEISPNAQYTFQWSDGTTLPSADNLGSGDYTLTVTNTEGCIATGNFEILSTEALVFSNVQSTPGNCIQNGDIIIELFTEGPGPIVLNITGPGSITTLSLPPGLHNLSAYTNTPIGDYGLIAYDQTAGMNCSDSSLVSILDTSISINLVNDTFMTTSNIVLNENVLLNDQGFHLSMTSVDSVVGGTVSYISDGTIAFVPQAGFSGTASFLYTAVDTCTNIDTAYVQISINDVNCDFGVTFNNEDASCGDDDGHSFVSVNEFGNYTFVWDNGIIGQNLFDVPAGFYTVSVTNTDLNCTLEFQTEIQELPPEYITEIEIQQATCTIDANIIFELESNGSNEFDIVVFYPDDDDEFTVSSGVIFLGDYVPIIEGDYFITVSPSGIGYPCIESFTATINPIEGITIEAVDISPTSSPTASDGEVTIEITGQGTEPYTVLLNGSFWGTVSGTLFTISELAATDYTIQIIDNEGCTSNQLVVTIPFQTSFYFTPGYAMIYDNIGENLIEHSSKENVSSTTYYAQQSIFIYKLFGFTQESTLSLSMNSNYRLVQLTHLAEVWSTGSSKMNIGLHSGIATSLTNNSNVSWLLISRLNTELWDRVNSRINLGLKLNGNSMTPFAEFSIQHNFGH